MTPAPTQPDSKAVALSGRLYQRLLAAYPKAHRREYGPPMAQLFRDQCRDAWRAGRGWSLAWLRALPDLVKSSVLEHLSTLNERKTMLERLSMLLRPRSAPWLVFSGVFVLVFFFVVATTTLITFIMPESYSSTALVQASQAASEVTRAPEGPAPDGEYDPHFLKTQLELIQSEAVLGKVIDALDLNQTWGKKYADGTPLKTSETLVILKKRIDLRTVRATRIYPVGNTRSTGLIEIRVFSDQPSEAARLANAIAQSYREYRSRIASADIVDRAVPGLRPVRPNKPLNIALGILAGMFLALASGAGMAGIAAWIGRRSRGTAAPRESGTVSPPDLPPGDGGHPKTTLDNVSGS